MKDLFRKFSYNKEFISGFSAVVFREVIADQLSSLKQRYISDRSQLLEMICVSWAEHHHTLENYLRYEAVLPQAMNMLTHASIGAEAASLLVGLVKSLILNTLEQPDKVKDSDAAERRGAFL